MNRIDSTQGPDSQELNETHAEKVGGGGELCSAEDLVAITGSLTQSYENLVNFASHVIERVAGGTSN